MYHHKRTLLLVGVLMLCFQTAPKALAEECIELRVHAWKMATCCKQEIFIEPDTMSACFKTSDAEYPDHKLEAVVCAFDCAYREMGFLEAQYDINVENINFPLAAQDTAYQEAFANAVDHCLTTKDKMVHEVEMVATACSSFAVKFHACIILHVMQNCPADRWDASPLCEQIQNGVPICTR